MMLTVLIWLRYYLPGFSTVSWGRWYFDVIQCPVTLKLLLTNFSNHWWIVPVTTTMVFYGDFLFSSFLLYLLIGLLWQGRVVLSSSLFIQLFIYTITNLQIFNYPFLILKSTTSPSSLGYFYWKWYFETKIWAWIF